MKHLIHCYEQISICGGSPVSFIYLIVLVGQEQQVSRVWTFQYLMLSKLVWDDKNPRLVLQHDL